MGATTITKTVITRNAATNVPAAATVAKDDGALVTFDKDDQKILLLLKNNVSNVTHTAVIKAGNGIQGVSDLEITLTGTNTTAGNEKAVVIESGRYMDVSGDNKGKVNIVSKDTTTGDQIEVRAIVLP
jgi:hypothetical protein